ncbi:unnamed protein product, partial [Tetraodon nigroviridis]
LQSRLFPAFPAVIITAYEMRRSITSECFTLRTQRVWIHFNHSR